jgi:hypothetical protein
MNNANATTQTISGRLVTAQEFNDTALHSYHMTLDIKLKSGARSARAFKPVYDDHFGKTFLLFRGPNGEVDALKGLNTDTALALINDPKREAVLTFFKQS